MFKPTFGQPAANTSFGFGAPSTSTPFGQTGFGKIQNTSGFGTPAFGSNTTAMFGAQNQPNTGGLFSSTTTTPAFGQPTPAQSGFGTFGNTGTTNTLFGQQQGTPGNLFGSTPTTAFGQNKPAAFSSFGSTPSNNLFGGTQTQTAQATTTPLFGQSTPANPGLFGNTPAFGNTQAQSGTTIKFNPVSGTDTMMKNRINHTITTRHHCITCMKEYETKSLEELRFEDYLANRKGPQQGAQGSTNMFGTISTPNVATSGLFGAPANPSTGFGQASSVFGAATQTSSNLFGQKPTGFGATTTSTSSPFSFNPTPTATPFGATAAKPFSTQATGSGLFSTPTTASTNTFGQTSTSFGFGAPTSSASSGFFNQNKTATSTFSMPATNTTGFGFGQPQNNLFGAAKSTVFGTPSNTFGQPNATQQSFGSSFGQPQQNNLLFSSPSFNKQTTGPFGVTQPNNSGVLVGFGNQQQQSGVMLFGCKPNTNLFGPPQQPAQNNLFGGAFGMQNTTVQFGQNVQQTVPSAFNTPPGSVSNIHEVLIAISSPYPEQAILKNLTPLPESKVRTTNPVAVQNLLDEQLRVSTKPPTNVHRVRSLKSPEPVRTLFDGLEANDPSIEENIFATKPRNPRCLVIRKFHSSDKEVDKSVDDTSKTISPLHVSVDSPRLLTNDTLISSPTAVSRIGSGEPEWAVSSYDRESVKTKLEMGTTKSKSSLNTPSIDPIPIPTSSSTPARISATDTPPVKPKSTPSKEIDLKGNDADTDSPGCLRNSSRLSSPYQTFSPNDEQPEYPPTSEVSITEPHPTGITCTRPGYYTIPLLDDLIPLIKPDGSIIVNSFTIGRRGYGNVFFPDSFDIANINVDEHVHFRSKELTIYVDDTNKPPLGTELNRPAQVTLDRVFPRDKQTCEPITDIVRLFEMDYEGILRSSCIRHGTKFVEYRPETGSWVFLVEHFTRYGITDNEESRLAHINHLLSTIPLEDEMMNISPRFEDNDDEDVCMAAKRPKEDQSISNLLMASQIPEGIPESEQEGYFRKISAMRNTFFQDDEVESVTSSQSGALLTVSKYVDLLTENARSDLTLEEEEAEIRRLQKKLENERKEPKRRSYSPRGVLMPRYEPVLPRTSHMEVTQSTDLHDFQYDEEIRTPEYAPRLSIVMKSFFVLDAEEFSDIFSSTRDLCDLSVFQGVSYKSRFSNNGDLLSLSKHFDTDPASMKFPGPVPFVMRYSYKTVDLFAYRREESTRGVDSFFKDYFEPHLQIQLEHCDIENEENPFPFAYALAGPKALHQHSEKAQVQLFELTAPCFTADYLVYVWKLFEALWGENLKIEGELPRSHLINITRRECFGQWMEEYMMDEIKSKRGPTSYGDSNVTLMDYLVAHQLYDAYKHASDNDLVHLGIIITQFASGATSKAIIMRQLEKWQICHDFITTEIVKIYLLLAGNYELKFGNSTINVYENLSWMQALAIHLWYLTPHELTIRDAVQCYTDSFNCVGSFCPSPTPLYTHHTNQEISGNMKIYDLLYHLTNVYCDSTYSMEKTLNTANYTTDPLDYSISWLVMENLKALGYENILEKSEVIIHLSFAEQLEREGMWHWAVFVLLHIREESVRRSYVVNMINKHVSLNKDDDDYLERERFMLTELKIPPIVFVEAKAIKATQLGRWRDAMTYYLLAENRDMTLKLFWDHVCPVEMCNKNYSYIKNYLHLIFSKGYQDDMHVLLFYYIQEIVGIVQSIKQGSLPAMQADDLIRMKCELTDVCNKIIVTKCSTLEQRVMITHMCKDIVNIIKENIESMGTSELINLTVVALLSIKLPLPPDYVIQELRDVVTLYVTRFMECTDDFTTVQSIF